MGARPQLMSLEDTDPAVPDEVSNLMWHLLLKLDKLNYYF